MNELIKDVEEIIRTHQHRIKRNEIGHEFSSMSEYDHLFRLALLHRSLEIWESCLQLILKYRKKREVPVGAYSGEVIEQIIKAKANCYVGIPIKTQEKIIEYIKTLEWQLEGALHCEYGAKRTQSLSGEKGSVVI